MTAKVKLYLINFIVFIIIVFYSGCVKEVFVEPQNPFIPQRLDPNPAVFQLGVGDSAVILKTNRSNVEETPEGIRIKGAIYTENEKYGDMHLTNGDLFLLTNNSAGKIGSTCSTEYGNLPVSRGEFFYIKEDTIISFNSLTGYALLDFPKVGPLSLIEGTGSPVGGAFIFAKGDELKAEDPDYYAPLNPNRYYYLLDLEAGPPIKIGNIGMGGTTRFAIDLMIRTSLQGAICRE